MRRLARFTSWVGLTAAGALHAIWATGSTWPARNTKELADATVGTSKEVPSREGTWAVAGLAFTGAVIGAGGLGEGRAVVAARRIAGGALLARAATGGAPVLAVMGYPNPSARFRELDRKYYRPFFAVLGLALIVGARRRKPRE